MYTYRDINQHQPFHYRQLSQLQHFKFRYINFYLFIIILLHKVVILHIWEPTMKTRLKPSLTLRRDCKRTEILFLLALSYSFKYLSTYSQIVKQRSFLWNLQPFAFSLCRKNKLWVLFCCFGFRHTGIMNRERGRRTLSSKSNIRKIGVIHIWGHLWTADIGCRESIFKNISRKSCDISLYH